MTSLSHYSAAIVEEALAICHGGALADPDKATFLHLRGLLAARDEMPEYALACLARAAALDPNRTAHVADLAEALSRSGRAAEAVGTYLRAIRESPSEPELYRGLADALARSGQIVAAIGVCREALRLDPAGGRTYGDLGDLLWKQGQLSEAMRCYEASVSNGADIEAFRRLGLAYLLSGEWAQALSRFRQALQLWPGRGDLLAGVGRALLHMGSIADAAEAFRTVLSTEPKDVQACRYLVLTLELLGHRRDAVDAWCGLGAALDHRGLFEDAIRAYNEAIARKPGCLRAMLGSGHGYLELGRPREALECFERVLDAHPEHHEGHVGISYSSHLLKNAARGWQEHALCRSAGQLRKFEQPLWDGSLIEGRTILVWADEGFGDAVQYFRYLQLVKDHGARVVVQCDWRLVALAKGLPCVDVVTADGAPLPSFDVQVPLSLLPSLFMRESVAPRVPYLTVDRNLKERWLKRLGMSPDKKIGIVWGSQPASSGTRFRCVPLAIFAPLAQVAGIRLISLQLGVHAGELLSPPPGLHIETTIDDSSSAEDTAAIIMGLDLVISIDTLVAHLAGALGKPVWTLLRFAAEWRWSLEGMTTHWYPTMRLFRQERPGDWTTVIERVRAALGATDWSEGR
jgi:tetratricopeptide (TPR) repeat protein